MKYPVSTGDFGCETMVYDRIKVYNKYKSYSNVKQFHRDKNAGLEGMPLQLLIIVVIAVMALGMIMSWMSSVNEPPKSIKVIGIEVDGGDEDIDLSKGNPREIKITVYDSELRKIDGAIVTLDGCGFYSETKKTGNDGQQTGTAVFDGNIVELPPSITTGEIMVTVKKADHPTKTTSILVFKS